MSRLSKITYQNFTKEQRELFDHISRGKRGTGRDPLTFLDTDGAMTGPFNAMLYTPVFGETVQRMGEAVRFEGSIPDPLREMAILMVAAKWHADFEWQAHEKIARKAGLSPDVIDKIKKGTLPLFEDREEEAVYHFARELLDNFAVSDRWYETAVEHFGESGTVELVVTLGFYTQISMILKVF